MSIEDKAREFAENLALLPGMEEKFTYLIQLGRKYPPLPESLRTPDRLLPGCMSNLWLCPEMREGRCHYQMDADAALVKGVAALLCGLYSGETPEDIVRFEPKFMEESGLTLHLSSRRLTGLGNLRGAIKKFAFEHLPAAAGQAAGSV
ncbi:MAG: SufE family protein [Terrimicrobiaceae bacterium]|nr:SufE family protein [Terrimicrobiaceae bacterium]